ncbi:MAG: hypothetical protein K6L73_14755 [Cellvibrionaceae bacterium]
MYKTLLAIFVILSISGCSKEVNYNALEKYQGLYYEIETGELFTGLVDDFPSYSKNSIFGQLAAAMNKSVQNRHCRAEMVDGLLDGQLECKHPDTSNTLLTIEYKKGKKHGTERSWNYETGNSISELNYKNDKLHGKQKLWNNETEELTKEENYEYGKLNGRKRKWDKHGVLLEDLEYKNNVRISGINTAYEPGKICIEHYENKLLNGKKECYRIQTNSSKDKTPIKGSLISKRTYKDGKIIGTSKYWYKNGEIHKEIEHSDNNPVSERLFDQTGTKITDLNYKNNKINNGFITKVKNSKICIERYNNGSFHGINECHAYTPPPTNEDHTYHKGKLLTQEEYNNGILEKSKEWLDPLIIEEHYKNGRKNKIIRHRIEDGKLLFRNTYINIQKNEDNTNNDMFVRDGKFTHPCGGNYFTSEWDRGAPLKGTYVECKNNTALYSLDFTSTLKPSDQPEPSLLNRYNPSFYITTNGQEVFGDKNKPKLVIKWDSKGAASATSYIKECKQAGCEFNRPEGETGSNWLLKEIPCLSPNKYCRETSNIYLNRLTINRQLRMTLPYLI